jgi:preprotein translocase subunit SecA
VPTLIENYRLGDVRIPKDPPKGADAVVNNLIGRWRRRGSVIRKLWRTAQEIDRLAEDYQFLNDHALRQRCFECREAFRRNGAPVPAMLPQALAAVREAAVRQLKQKPYPVQLMGALALLDGKLVEMTTGEGKTLTAGLAGVLAGWCGKPVHLITVNDYLAQRDAQWMGPLYEWCGVSVGFVTSKLDNRARAEAYSQDVTYTTSKEIVADFLRDRIQLGSLAHPTRRFIYEAANPKWKGIEGVVQRGLHTAIVDEADSVLIDEAVTPLIISAPQDNETLTELYGIVWKIAETLEAGPDYKLNLRYREVELLPAGESKVIAKLEQLPTAWRSAARPIELVEQALTAREFFIRGKQYVVRDNEVVIVDEFTGRLMPMRKWRHGLHQAIEAKEGVKISAVDTTLARLSFQRFFRLYQRISGMTGTAREASSEFWQVYKLPVVAIPTNRPCIRRQLPVRVHASPDKKLNAVVDEIRKLHAGGRPVLVGTRSVALSQQLAERLDHAGLVFNLLNALNDREEAGIISQAGREGAITIATNMAGRGTDIILGAGVAAKGGLHVIATEHHESGRIDRQLYGRSGRQGDAGTATCYLCVDDELFVRFAPAWLTAMLRSAIASRAPGSKFAANTVIRMLQIRAQRLAFRSRKSVMRMDTWLDEALSFAGNPGA